ncbi:phage holin family protein [Microbacterium hominis]|nr:phage holin family protein [Microbacterium hominis]
MFLIRAAIFLVSAAIGLIAADLILPGFQIDWADWWGFLLAIVIFAVLQSVLAPWLARVAQRNAPVLLGGIGIVSTFVALLIVVLIPGAGLTIGSPWWTWLLAPVIVWIFTALATWLLPVIFVKKKIEDRRDEK